MLDVAESCARSRAIAVNVGYDQLCVISGDISGTGRPGARRFGAGNTVQAGKSRKVVQRRDKRVGGYGYLFKQVFIAKRLLELELLLKNALCAVFATSMVSLGTARL